MRCPSCKQRVIEFEVWGRGINAFRKIECPHCGTSLRVSRRTIIVFISLIVFVGVFAVASAMALDAIGVTASTAKVIAGCLVIALATAGAYFEWKTGFYALQEVREPQGGDRGPRGTDGESPTGEGNRDEQG